MLLDTDILIDYLRCYQPSVQFLDRLDKKDRIISIITHFELFQGCRNKQDEQRISSYLQHFNTVGLNSSIGKKALLLFQEFRLVSHLSMADSLIAATAIINKISLFTRNTKHFDGLPSLKLENPYT